MVDSLENFHTPHSSWPKPADTSSLILPVSSAGFHSRWDTVAGLKFGKSSASGAETLSGLPAALSVKDYKA